MNPPDPETFDSTQLIKDIELFFQDPVSGQPDSVTETYTYDTVNRKIKTVLNTPSSFYLKGFSAEYSYSTDHLLTSINYTYPAAYTPDNNEPITISIEYDNDKVPKRIVFNHISAPAFTINYAKIDTGTGYHLIWQKEGAFPDWVDKYKYTFNNKKQLIRSQQDLLTFDQNGNRVDSTWGGIDSIVYSPTGDVQSVYVFYNIFPAPVRVLYYEFGDRYDKGDQLSKQRQLLFRGVENIPYTIDNYMWFIYNNLFSFYDHYASNQIVGFPCRTSMYNYLGGTAFNKDHEAIVDSLDRLVYYSGYNIPVAEGEVEWKVTYYK